MKVKVLLQNSKWAILAFVFIAFFLRLGFWQLDRAQQKTALLDAFQHRMHQPALKTSALRSVADARFYRVQLEGSFDIEHSFLLDNKISHGKIGYEVYTPFKVKGLEAAILVDRGWVPLGETRAKLPNLPLFTENHLLSGILNLPPTYVALGEIKESKEIAWPLRIEFIELQKLSTLLNYQLFPYVVQLDPQDPAAFSIEWHMVTMSPEKHRGYAVQWFALALTLLILFIALNRRRS
jgi:surfeit locus 1 family protein